MPKQKPWKFSNQICWCEVGYHLQPDSIAMWQTEFQKQLKMASKKCFEFLACSKICLTKFFLGFFQVVLKKTFLKNNAR